MIAYLAGLITGIALTSLFVSLATRERTQP